MIIPIRCFTCGKVIGDKWNKFNSSVNNGMSKTDAFAELNVKRYCCKRMFLGHVELIDKLLLYSENNHNHLDENSKD